MKTLLTACLVLTTVLPTTAGEPPILDVQMYAGITITGSVGSVYAIQATTNLADTNVWLTLTNLSLPASSSVFIDYDSPDLTHRFYWALDTDANVPGNLSFEDPPIDLRGINASFARNVSYGPYEDNVFDIFLVESAAPTPLVIYIHGGAFASGDKGVVYLSARNEIREVLSNGVSYATINYRLLDEVDDEGVNKPLRDCRRCLQFLRYYHEELNLDPSRVALYGASAGAGTSLWLGFTDEMADPIAADPIFRESTRVRAVGARAAQATYDLLKWETVVFASLGFTLEDMAALPNASEQGLLSFYGADSFEDLGTPEFVAYRQRVDMLQLMSPDDPPFWVENDIANTNAPTDKGELMHHTLHAVALKDQAAQVGLECQAYIPPLGVADPTGDSVVKFLLDRLRD